MDPLSIFTLVTFCIQASASLYQTIDESQSRKQDVIYLKTEIRDLNVVLQALGKNIEDSTDDFEMLKLILSRCGQACKEFEMKVLDVLNGSKSAVEQLRAWTKLQFMGSDINNFRKLIGSYKSTVTIALADYNLYSPPDIFSVDSPTANLQLCRRTSTVTRQLIEKYTDLTNDTAAGLEEQIVELSDKLEVLRAEHGHRSPDGHDIDPNPDHSMAKRALDQKVSLEQCLVVCHQLLNHMEEVKSMVPGGTESIKRALESRHPSEGARILGPRLTADAVKMCIHNLGATAQQLQDLRGRTKPFDESGEAEIMRQLDGTRNCLNLVEKAQEYRINYFENIAVGDDSLQTAVSTMGDLIRARGLNVGARSVNIMGQMNDESLQILVRSYSMKVPEPPTTDGTSAKFEDRHGFGRTMNASRQ